MYALRPSILLFDELQLTLVSTGAFALYDVNDDGFISREEMLRIVRPMQLFNSTESPLPFVLSPSLRQ